MNLSKYIKKFKIYALKQKKHQNVLIPLFFTFLILLQVLIFLNFSKPNSDYRSLPKTSKFSLYLPQILKSKPIFYSTAYDQKIEKLTQTCIKEPNFNHCYKYNLISTEVFLDSLTLEEQIKQLLAPAFSYERMKNNNIDKSKFGAYVIIRSNNYNSSEEIHTDIQNQFKKNQQIPAFIGVDAEGGIIQRFSWHKITHLSKLTGLSQNKLCSKIEKDISIVKNSGFNWSLAPVIDLPYSQSDWITNRSISQNKNEIIKTAQNYIECLRSNQILTTLKHFPGHGDSNIDSHYETPIIDHSKEEWINNEGAIYKSLINNNSAETIMTGHIQYPKISSEIASISIDWQDEVLREELGFEGLIVTDDIVMLSTATEKNCYELTWDAIKSGADIVIFVENNGCSSNKKVDFLVERYKESSDNANIIDKKIVRVLKFKKEWFNW